MPVMNFDLEDGKAPVSFTLKPEDAERFMAFMNECNKAVKDMEAVYDMFAMGRDARKPHILMSCIENLQRRFDCLAAIEREFFIVPSEPDDDYPDEDPGEECLLNWGASPEEYVEQFRTALASISAK